MEMPDFATQEELNEWVGQLCTDTKAVLQVIDDETGELVPTEAPDWERRSRVLEILTELWLDANYAEL